MKKREREEEREKKRADTQVVGLVHGHGCKAEKKWPSRVLFLFSSSLGVSGLGEEKKDD